MTLVCHPTPQLPLLAHPSTPAPAVQAIQSVYVQLQRHPNYLELSYRVQASANAVLLPEATSPRAQDGLWEHTCLELFVAVPEAAGYREFNFSPSGAWAAYAFSAYRQRQVWNDPLAPTLQLKLDAQGWTLQVQLPIPTLPDPHGPLQLGLSAVLESPQGDKSYWALCHPQARPDFHHRAGFSLDLAPA